MIVKLNARDGVERGLTLDDSLQVGAWLKEREIDALEISGGLLNIANLLDNKTECGRTGGLLPGGGQGL